MRPGLDHRKKAGAMNSLIRVLGVLSIVPYLLNVGCDHYIYNSKTLREAMCFVVTSKSGKDICYVHHYPQRDDRYINGNILFFGVSTQYFYHQKDRSIIVLYSLSLINCNGITTSVCCDHYIYFYPDKMYLDRWQ